MKKLNIVDKVMAFLKVGEEGKINSFFINEVDRLENDIVMLEHEKASLELNNSRAIKELEKEKEDLTKELEEAYLTVVPEKVATNKLQREFSEEYWDNIEKCGLALENVGDRLKALSEKYEEDLDKLTTQITRRKGHIKKLANG